jgi:RecB family exonuclease
MARLSKEELDKIKEKNNCSRIWSWSRVNTFMTSPYEYYLKYVLHKKEDRDDCGYAPLGSISHDALDNFYEGEIAYEDMISQFEDGWLTAIDIADLKLDRNDEVHDASIKAKYKEDLQHFFKNHVKYDYKVLIEKPVIAKIEDNVFVGYIDALFKDNDGNYHIVDFKTSSKYSGKTAEEKSGQLTIYAMALIQAGVPLEKVRICWNFLKYCTVEYQQKNGTVKTREIERCKIGESLQSNAKMWLKNSGYDEDEVDDYLKLLIDTNSIDALPDEVREKYKMYDCHVYVPLTQKLIDKWVDIIVANIKDIYTREKDYEETKSDKCFFDTDENVKAQSYYFSTLMGYSASLHKPYAEYLDKLEKQKTGIDLFAGVGESSENNVVTSQDICNNKSDDIDLSWLTDLM